MLRVIGEVVDYAEKPWEMTDRTTGQMSRGTSRTARVQTSRKDFIDVKLPEDWAQKGNQWPQDGDEVDWVVIPRAGDAGRLRINVDRVYTAPIPSPRRQARDSATASV